MPCDGFPRKRRLENLYARDKTCHGDTILDLSVEPKDLTFVQVSLRGIVVFLATTANAILR